MSGMRYGVATRVKLVVAMVLGGLLAAPIAAVASHHFADVPNGHPFHTEIGVVADAGIAQGFDDGTYRPGNTLTRQAMAAFLERAVGRAGFDGRSRALGTDGAAVVAGASVDAGATGAGTAGFVVLIGTAYASTSSAASCPCLITMTLSADGEYVDAREFNLPGEANHLGQSSAVGTIQSIVEIAGDESRAYQLSVHSADPDVPSVSASGHLTALYVPLGPDGDSTMEYEHTCNSQAAENNDTPGTATPLGTGGCRRSAFSKPNDLDYFSLTVLAGHTLTVTTRSADGAGCEGDTSLLLLNANATQIIADDDDGGAGPCSRIVRTGLEAGTYLIRANAKNPLKLFDYRITATQLSVSSAPPLDTDIDEAATESSLAR